jgi:hypothetical protein
LPSLLSGLRAVCAGFPDVRKGRRDNIAIADFGLSAFALFFMQSASFLAFQRTPEKGHGRSNCQTLFGIGKIPSDPRSADAADPALLQHSCDRPRPRPHGRIFDRNDVFEGGRASPRPAFDQMRLLARALKIGLRTEGLSRR